MKTKTIAAVFACILSAAFALGFSDTIRVADQTDGGASPGAGRLIGAFITREYLDLFDAEAFFNDNAGQIMAGGEMREEQLAAYEGRLYATLVDKPLTDEEGRAVNAQEYVFEGVDGICYFAAEMRDETGTYTASSGDEAISDGHMALSYTDEGDCVTLEASVYVSTQSGIRDFYINPVYQTEDGRVYTVAGNGMSMGGDLTAGLRHTATLTESQALTHSGETTVSESSVTIAIEYVAPPQNVSVVQLDENSRVVSRADYRPGALPDTLAADPAAAYIVVETHFSGTGVKRDLYQQGDESLTSVFCRGDGVCIEAGTAIVW